MAKGDVTINSNFKMDEQGNVDYTLTCKGNVPGLVKLGHEIFIQCKERWSTFRREEDKKFNDLFKDNN